MSGPWSCPSASISSPVALRRGFLITEGKRSADQTLLSAPGTLVLGPTTLTSSIYTIMIYEMPHTVKNEVTCCISPSGCACTQADGGPTSETGALWALIASQSMITPNFICTAGMRGLEWWTYDVLSDRNSEHHVPFGLMSSDFLSLPVPFVAGREEGPVMGRPLQIDPSDPPPILSKSAASSCWGWSGGV